MIQAIYTDRTFVVADGGETSQGHVQHFGISQGCPLSFFLFVMVMTVLLQDAKSKMQQDSDTNLATSLLVNELVCADDTLPIDLRGDVLQKFMEYVAAAGREYGLSVNWKKLEMLPMRCKTWGTLPLDILLRFPAVLFL